MNFLQRTFSFIVLGGFALLSVAQSETPNSETAIQNAHPNIVPTEGMKDLHLVLNSWYALDKMPADSVADNDVIPFVSDSAFAERLRRLPCVIDMTFNPVVSEYIDRYTFRLRRSVTFMLGAQNYYMPIFEEALEAEGVPLELKYLPVVESALDPTAVSSAGAAGLWQFMVQTGKRFDLDVSSLVDERRDPVKSSRAAARYLKELYQQFGDWTLALAAYNCGPNNVEKAIRRSGGARNYWAIYDFLPKETRGYVPAFIAANYVMNYYCEHGIPAMRIEKPIDTDTVMVNRELHFQQIADVCGLDVKLIEALNPQYRRSLIPGNAKPSALRLPTIAIDGFLTREMEVADYRSTELLDRTRSIELGNRGDGAYEEPTEDSRTTKPRNSRRQERNEQGSNARNSAEPARNTRNEEKTKKKTKNESAKTKREQKEAERDAEMEKSRSKKHDKKARQQANEDSNQSVTVKNGQTLSEIAEKHGTTVAKLRKLNKISDNNIRAGESLRVK